MPRIIVQLTGDRPIEQKRRLVAGITDATVEALSVQPGDVTIRLEIVEPENFAKSGRLASDDPTVRGGTRT